MNLPSVNFLPAAVALFGLFIIPAQSAPVVYEPFDYATTGTDGTDNISLGGSSQNGGTGFAGAWQTDVDQREWEIVSPGGSFSDGSNDLQVSGNQIQRDERNGFVTSFRSISSTSTTALTADNTTMWMSFLYTNGGFANDASITLTSERAALANNHSLNASGYGVGITSEGGFSTAYYNGGTSINKTASALDPNPAAGTFLLAAKIVWNEDGTNDEIYLFNITDLTSEPVNGDNIASATFDMLLSNQQSLDVLNVVDTQTNYVDEIRLGNSFGDVVPVPEPSAFALLAGVLAMSVMVRRRR